MDSRQQIAEELLGCALEDGFAPCPGQANHRGKTGKRDFRVQLDGAPTGYCFHTHCGEAVDAFNKALRQRVWRAEHPDAKGRAEMPPTWSAGVAAEPKAHVATRPEIDYGMVTDFIRGVPAITPDWLRRRSPEDPRAVDSTGFLGHLYAQDERVLVFTDQKTQGDFIWWGGHGTYRLAQQRNVKATPSALPGGAREGVWFLVQPVTGRWEIGKAFGDAPARWTRRSQVNVSAWRYYVLESDELPPEEWLRVLVNLPLPIAAIYTSGGRSIHALVRYQVGTKAEWDASRNLIRQLVCPLGADPAALTAVRLSRLPGCLRSQRPQELLYLAPSPEPETVMLRKEVRD